MGDMTENLRALSVLRQERHANWHRDNLAALADSGIPHRVANRGETLLFREDGKPRCDFYPSTGRWRVVNARETFSGGAVAFLAWYRRQES
jgi:hypothetical protein